MTVQSISGVVEAAIQRASSATGVDFGFLMRTAKRESGYNPSIRAHTSTGAGLYQFLDQSWLGILKQHGAKYGYSQYADMIQRGSDGRYYVAGGAEARASVMDLRLDPRASAYMAGELAAGSAAYLRGRIGREPSSGELYAAHMLGPAGSAKLIEAMRGSPGGSAVALFPEAAAANKSIFYRNGQAATVAQVYANLTATPSGAAPIITTTPPQAAPAEQGPFVEFASVRRTEQMQEEEMLVAVLLRGSGGSSDDSGLTLQTANSLFSTEMLRAMAEKPKV
jgi:hypothetical protein